MLEWHDCKSDPPKKCGYYLLYFEHYNKTTRGKIDIGVWIFDYFNRRDGAKYKEQPIKWAEVELPEVE